MVLITGTLDDDEIKFRNKQTGRSAWLFGGIVSWVVFRYSDKSTNPPTVFNIDDKKEAFVFALSFVEEIE